MNEQKLREQFQHAVQTRLSGLEPNPCLAQSVMAGSEKAKQKNTKRSFGLILAIVLTLALAGAVAAVIHWNVMEFVFGAEKPEATFLVKNIEAQTSDGQVTLTVNSILCDGEMLALDWTVCNAKPASPVFLQLERLHANGAVLQSDGNDGFDGQWLPGVSNEGTMQDGEILRLPGEVEGDILNFEMTVGVYHPRKPVYIMNRFDEQEAQKKTEEGYYILAEGDGFVLPDPETGGLMHCFGGINENELESYERTELVVSCKLNLSKARAACINLVTEPHYQMEGLTVKYTKAKLTPVAFYLTLEITGGDFEQYNTLAGNGQFILTDGEGTPFEHPSDYYEAGGYTEADGSTVWRSSHMILDISADELPKTMSLSLLGDDPAVKYVFPVKLPAE
ncbi:MAG: hypothetical protein RR142_04600 [Clostridia bacterium]